MLCSTTRLRLRSVFILPAFYWHASRSLRQARSAQGCLGTAIRRTGRLTFWTMTSWTDERAMRSYMGTGAHRVAMPRLAGWCSEASAAHWEQDEPPTWDRAEGELRERGKVSRVARPSAAHASGNTVPEA